MLLFFFPLQIRSPLSSRRGIPPKNEASLSRRSVCFPCRAQPSFPQRHFPFPFFFSLLALHRACFSTAAFVLLRPLSGSSALTFPTTLSLPAVDQASDSCSANTFPSPRPPRGARYLLLCRVFLPSPCAGCPLFSRRRIFARFGGFPLGARGDCCLPFLERARPSSIGVRAFDSSGASLRLFSLNDRLPLGFNQIGLPSPSLQVGLHGLSVWMC